MGREIYVVLSFSRGHDGALARDAPAWSQDRTFAAALSHALAKRKTGVVALGTTLDASGRLSPEAEIIAAYGSVPTSLVSVCAVDETLLESASAMEGCDVEPVRLSA